MKVHIETYGCTANQGDSQGIRNAIAASGGTIVDRPGEADVIIVNTCAVTEPTSRSMLKAIGKYKNKRVIAAGCMAAAQPQLLEGLWNVERASAPGPEAVARILGLRPAAGEPLIRGRTATIPIARGCAGRCSYCIVRLVRGPLRSVPPAAVEASVKKALDMGAKEVFLTAQDTGAYGMDMGLRLPELMRGLLKLEGDHRIRLGMMNPFSIAPMIDDMIDVFNHPLMYKFAHIPVQSGSDRILKLMNRPYTEGQYGDMVERLKEGVPGLTLSTDYIVGFPMESDDDFALTMEDLRRNSPLKVNITRYSPRPGTPAAAMEGLPFRIKKDRSRALTRLHHEVTADFMKASIGRRLSVLVAEEGKPGTSVARDDSYHMVVIPRPVPPGTRLEVKVCGASTTYMFGEPTEK